MKKVITLFLCLLMVIALAACGNNDTDTENNNETNNETNNSDETELTEESSPEVNWTLDTVPVPDEMKEFAMEQGDNCVEYVNRNVSYDVLTSYEDLLTEKGFTIVQNTLEPQLYEATATQNNATVHLYFETADWDLTDPEFLANGGAGLDTSIFSIIIEVESVE